MDSGLSDILNVGFRRSATRKSLPEDPETDVSNSKRERSLMVSRSLRENAWKDQMVFEGEVMKPYLAVFNAPPHEWLEFIESHSEVILKTNGALQKKLAALEKTTRKMETEYEHRSKEWELMQSKFQKSKENQKAVEQQLRDLREARAAEEQHLREQAVELDEKYLTLLKKQRSLEAQKREDDRKVRVNRELLEELAFMQSKLELKKAEYEFDHDLAEAGSELPAAEAEEEMVKQTTEEADAERERERSPPGARASVATNASARDYGDFGMIPSRAETPFSAMETPLDSRPMSAVDPMFVDESFQRMSPVLRGTPTPQPQRVSPSSRGSRGSPPRSMLPHGVRGTPPPRATPSPGVGAEACAACGHMLLPDALSCRKCGMKR